MRKHVKTIQSIKDQSEVIKLLGLKTQNGNPEVKGSPFAVITTNFSKKPYYGQVKHNSFSITKNSNLIPLPVILDGFITAKNNETKIILEKRPIWFGYLWIRVIPVLGVIGFNTILIVQSNPVPLELFLILNSFFVLMFSIMFFIYSNGEKKFIKRVLNDLK